MKRAGRGSNRGTYRAGQEQTQACEASCAGSGRSAGKPRRDQGQDDWQPEHGRHAACGWTGRSNRTRGTAHRLRAAQAGQGSKRAGALQTRGSEGVRQDPQRSCPQVLRGLLRRGFPVSGRAADERRAGAAMLRIHEGRKGIKKDRTLHPVFFCDGTELISSAFCQGKM